MLVVFLAGFVAVESDSESICLDLIKFTNLHANIIVEVFILL